MDIPFLLNTSDAEDRDIMALNGTRTMERTEVPLASLDPCTDTQINGIQAFRTFTPESSTSPLSSAFSSPRLKKRYLKRETSSDHHMHQRHPYSRPINSTDSETSSSSEHSTIHAYSSSAKKNAKNPRKNFREKQKRAELTVLLGYLERTMMHQNPKMPELCGWKLLARHNTENEMIPEEDRLQHNKDHILHTTGLCMEHDAIIFRAAIGALKRADGAAMGEVALLLEALWDVRGSGEFEEVLAAGKMKLARL